MLNIHQPLPGTEEAVPWPEVCSCSVNVCRRALEGLMVRTPKPVQWGLISDLSGTFLSWQLPLLWRPEAKVRKSFDFLSGKFWSFIIPWCYGPSTLPNPLTSNISLEFLITGRLYCRHATDGNTERSDIAHPRSHSPGVEARTPTQDFRLAMNSSGGCHCGWASIHLLSCQWKW